MGLPACSLHPAGLQGGPSSAVVSQPRCAERAWNEEAVCSGSLSGTELGASLELFYTSLPLSIAPPTLKGGGVGAQIPVSAESKLQVKLKGQEVWREAV